MSAQSQPLSAPATQAQPSPALFFENINGYQRTAALKAAIELDLFTAIAGGAHTAEAVALRCQASVRGIRILCDYLTAAGFLGKNEGDYVLTPDTATFLNRHSLRYIGGAIGFLTSPALMQNFHDVAACVRRGGRVETDEFWSQPEHPMWSEFARSMAPLMTLSAELLAQSLQADTAPKWKVLDLAAGHGMYGVTLARHNPNADIYAVDWSSVLGVARENAEKAGVIDRWHALPGSAFEVEFGSGYDLALLTNFLHHLDVATIGRLLDKVRRALAPQGRVVILEFIPDENRVSPPLAAQFALTMLVGTEGGDAYTFAEYERMCRNAGFRSSELRELPPAFNRAVIAHR